MPGPAKYEIKFSPETLDHLDAIERKYHRLVRTAIDQQLTYTPEEETRNRKPLERPAPFDAAWELRFGPDNRFRVFYEVDNAERSVWVLAMGVKVRNRLLIGGEEYEL